MTIKVQVWTTDERKQVQNRQKIYTIKGIGKKRQKGKGMGEREMNNTHITLLIMKESFCGNKNILIVSPPHTNFCSRFQRSLGVHRKVICKAVLRLTLNNRKVTEEVLRTIFIHDEALLNGGPLTLLHCRRSSEHGLS